MMKNNYLFDNCISRNNEFKEVEKELKEFKIQQNETFDFYLNSIDDLLEKVQQVKKNLEEKIVKKEKEICIKNKNDDKIVLNEIKNKYDIKELIKDVSGKNLTEKICEENKRIYNILLYSYRDIISITKQEVPEIFQNINIKKNIVLKLILLHFLQNGDFFMYYILNKEILEKRKMRMEKKNIKKINTHNTSEFYSGYNKDLHIGINKNSTIYNFDKINIKKNDIKLEKNIEGINKSEIFSNLKNFGVFKKIETSNKEHSTSYVPFSNEGVENNLIYKKKEFNNIEWDDKKKEYLINGKYSILLNNIKKCNFTNEKNNDTLLFYELKKEYISKIWYENNYEQIAFEHALIRKEVFEGYKKYHTILYNIKNFDVSSCIEWYNLCSENTKKKYHKLIYFLDCMNYLISSKENKEKALTCLRNLMVNYNENKAHISRLSSFICIGSDNLLFKDMFLNIHSQAFNYFKQAYNEEGINIKVYKKNKLEKCVNNNFLYYNYDKVANKRNKKIIKRNNERKNNSKHNIKGIKINKSHFNDEENRCLLATQGGSNLLVVVPILTNNKKIKNFENIKIVAEGKKDKKKKKKKNENILRRSINKNKEMERNKNSCLKKNKYTYVYQKIGEEREHNNRLRNGKKKSYIFCQKEYPLNIKINHNNTLVHNYMYKGKEYEEIMGKAKKYIEKLNKEYNSRPLCESYIESNIDKLFENENKNKLSLLDNLYSYRCENNHSTTNLIFKKKKKQNKYERNFEKRQDIIDVHDKLEKGWYINICSHTKDMLSEVHSDHRQRRCLEKIYRNKLDWITSPNDMLRNDNEIYLYKKNEMDSFEYYNRTNLYLASKILNKTSQFYDDNTTKILHNTVQNINSGYHAKCINIRDDWNSNYDINLLYYKYSGNRNIINNMLPYFSIFKNGYFCDMTHNNNNTVNFLNESCFIKKPNELKRKISRCKFLTNFSKNEKIVDGIESELESEKKKKKIKNNHDNLLSEREEVNSGEDGIDDYGNIIDSQMCKPKIIKKEPKNCEEEKGNEKERLSLKSTASSSWNNSVISSFSDDNTDSDSEFASKNAYFCTSSSSDENDHKDINKLKEKNDIIREEYLKKNTMEALSNKNNTQAYNRATLAVNNTRLAKTSIDVSRILLTHVLTNREIYNLHNSLSRTNSNLELRRIYLRWSKKKKKKNGNKRTNISKNKKKKKEKNESYYEKSNSNEKNNKKNRKKSKNMKNRKRSKPHGIKSCQTGVEENKNDGKKDKKNDSEMMKEVNKFEEDEKMEKNYNISEINKNDGQIKNYIAVSKRDLFSTNLDNKLDVNSEKNAENLQCAITITPNKKINIIEEKLEIQENINKIEEKEKKMPDYTKSEELIKRKNDETNENVDKIHNASFETKDVDKSMGSISNLEENSKNIKKSNHKFDIKEKVEKDEIPDEGTFEESTNSEPTRKGIIEIDGNNNNEEEKQIVLKWEESENRNKNSGSTDTENAGKDDQNESKEQKKKTLKKKKKVFFGSYKKNMKNKNYAPNFLREEKMGKKNKRNKNKENDKNLNKKNKESFKLETSLKPPLDGRNKCRKNNTYSSMHENESKKDKSKISGKKKSRKETNLENKQLEKNIVKETEKKVFIPLKSPLSILLCGGLISSKKLIEAETILKENNKRLEELKNSTSLNPSDGKIADKPIEKLRKEDNKKNKKQNSSLISNSLAIEVDLSGSFFFHSSFTCPISRDKSSKDNMPYLLTCGHVICKNCVDKIHAHRSKQFKCPMCPQYLNLLEIIPLYFN
ncbi:zinc finger protein, putative [Plasmodium berghei]|uniref:RING zinc finger protein, putative n=2 Tax=Plasmodium berghei TaxID=5821 RepID=A0A509ABR5_PLABA|nr:RING zinc finger protein, putative [Plasmodium berghei ANKA]CXH89699.1 zinc finger protein, putative [Plasmodium berghei]SCM15278.1 zinc finger protein, putative [Plasmodium berghei]SCM17073.1 zinc finger protein, putative [Plasmodium berghei]VUC54001.1 RING zinc finger protein, putative [Plasmodium berghei ANKA]|eukprot:XP_034419853.1 RING zinc finger protein, putative [Plasmodium berghei ANKA]